MGWIFVDKEDDHKDGMRSAMRRSMRSGYHHSTMGDGSEYERGYRYGYKHGWEDADDEDMEHYRRSRDSRGRYI